jgi:hypothetical protein
VAYQSSTAYAYQYVNMKQFIYEALLAELQSSNMDEIRVFTSDPLDQAYIPGIGINKVGLTEDSPSGGLGLVSQPPTYNADTKEYTTYSGVFMQEAVEVRVFHTNADERDKLGITILAVLFAIRTELLKLGIREITLSGGRDEQDNNLMSTPLFMHAIILHYKNPLDVQVTTLVDAIEGFDVLSALSEG